MLGTRAGGKPTLPRASVSFESVLSADSREARTRKARGRTYWKRGREGDSALRRHQEGVAPQRKTTGNSAGDTRKYDQKLNVS